MKNLEIYEKYKVVPKEAQRTITGGKLNGKTDINPMWRIKALTEQFGICGIGWYYIPRRKWLENCANGEIAAFVDIDLFIKVDGEWSQPISGTGGSMLVDTQKGKLVSNDDAFKMATTDAISVACKQLGIGADVYWTGDVTKYTKPSAIENPESYPKPDPKSTSTPSTSLSVKERVDAVISKFERGSAFNKKANQQNILALMDAMDPEPKIAKEMGEYVGELVKKYGGLKSNDLSELAFNSLIGELCEKFVNGR